MHSDSARFGLILGGMKMRKILPLAMLVSSMAGAGCGDNHYYYGGGGSEDSSFNDCGDSPVYGKHLFEIWQCRVGITMREDCSIGITNNPKNHQATYSGLDVTFNGLGTFALDPDFRFTAKYDALNRKLDRYGGYVLLHTECDKDHADNCAFVPVPAPFSNIHECMESEYYAGGVGGFPARK